QLPALDLLGTVQQSVSGALATTTEALGGLQTTVEGLGAGVQRTASVAASPSSPTSPAMYQLTTTTGSTTQTFSLPLCTPSTIDVPSTNQLTPTTIVSLCPVPLGLAGAAMVPPLGQPAQLYLSIQQIPGTAQFPASFLA